MGRPEKAWKDAWKPARIVPVGVEGGRLRSFNTASEKE